MKSLLRLITCSIMVLSSAGTLRPAVEQAALASKVAAKSVSLTAPLMGLGARIAFNVPLLFASQKILNVARTLHLPQEEEPLNERNWFIMGFFRLIRGSIYYGTLGAAMAMHAGADGVSTALEQKFYPVPSSHLASRALYLAVPYLLYSGMRTSWELEPLPHRRARAEKSRRYKRDVAVVAGWAAASMLIKKYVDEYFGINVPMTDTERVIGFAGDVVPYAIARAIS